MLSGLFAPALLGADSTSAQMDTPVPIKHGGAPESSTLGIIHVSGKCQRPTRVTKSLSAYVMLGPCSHHAA